MTAFNLDEPTVDAFGKEWLKFRSFADTDIAHCGGAYFDIVQEAMLPADALVLDAGCGSGRWSHYLSGRVKFIEAIDASDAVFAAETETKRRGIQNIRVSRASIAAIPFPNEHFDFIMCIGVLHHMPDAAQGLKQCVRKLKVGGHLLVYLYYDLEGRSKIQKLIFAGVNFIRRRICRLPSPVKMVLCDLIALAVYYPLARLEGLMKVLGYADTLPLSFYRDKSFWVMRNDALDRFGTPLEKRFSKEQIRQMMEAAGLTDIRFSPHAPFWHATGKKGDSCGQTPLSS